MVAVVAERGYDMATVEAVSERAGVSSDAFHRHFADREDCYLEAFASVADDLEETMIAAGDAQRAWPEAVRARLTVLLEDLAADPDLVRFTMTIPAAGRGGVVVRFRAMREGLLSVPTARPPDDAPLRPSRLAEEGLRGALAALILREAVTGDGGGLPLLLPALTELVLTPYLGREEAVRLARGAA